MTTTAVADAIVDVDPDVGNGDLDEQPATVDYLAKRGAEQLAQRIQGYWAGLGYSQIKVWVEPATRGAWQVRSNLERGLPPAAAECG
jgi:hypothetical protein